MKNLKDFISDGYGAYEIESFVDILLNTDINRLNGSDKKELLNLLSCFIASQPNYNIYILMQIKEIFNFLDNQLNL